jgi:hypothetical protein
MKIRPVKPTCSMWTDGQAGVQTYRKQFIVAFHDYAKAPNNLTDSTAINHTGTSQQLHITKKHNTATLQHYSRILSFSKSFFSPLPVYCNLSEDIQQLCWRPLLMACRRYIQWYISLFGVQSHLIEVWLHIDEVPISHTETHHSR